MKSNTKLIHSMVMTHVIEFFDQTKAIKLQALDRKSYNKIYRCMNSKLTCRNLFILTDYRSGTI